MKKDLFRDVCIHLPTQGTGYTPASSRGMTKVQGRRKTKELNRILLELGKADVVSTI